MLCVVDVCIPPFAERASMYQLSNLRAQFPTKGMFCITLMDSSLLDYL